MSAKNDVSTETAMYSKRAPTTLVALASIAAFIGLWATAALNSQAEDGAAVVRAAEGPSLQEFAVPAGSRPHDVAPASDGTVWYTAQATGQLGRLDPQSGESHQVKLGTRSAPHGVIVGPDGAAWITDGGQNAIVRVDPTTREVKVFPLPADTGYTNLNTLTFDKKGRVWFTGQSGYYGRLEPGIGVVTVWKA